MINLNELSSVDLMKIVKIRQKIEVYEAVMAKIFQEAEKKGPPLSVRMRNMRLTRKSQPRLRDMLSGVLQAAGVPMSVPEIYEASLLTGYQWRSQEPINALNVKMYTDKTFKKASPGLFVLRKKG